MHIHRYIFVYIIISFVLAEYTYIHQRRDVDNSFTHDSHHHHNRNINLRFVLQKTQPRHPLSGQFYRILTSSCFDINITKLA